MNFFFFRSKWEKVTEEMFKFIFIQFEMKGRLATKMLYIFEKKDRNCSRNRALLRMSSAKATKKNHKLKRWQIWREVSHICYNNYS